MTKFESRPIKDIPEDLIRRCAKEIWHYTVGFVRVEKSKQGEDAILLGSGVLVKVGGVCAILRWSQKTGQLFKVYSAL